MSAVRRRWIPMGILFVVLAVVAAGAALALRPDTAGTPSSAGADLTERYVDGPYRLVVLEGVSHWIPEQAPEQLAAAILDRVASS